MPELLGPTNPVPGYDQQPVRIQPPTPGDTSIQNIVDPTRVVRPDARDGQQPDNGDATASYAARYESNFMTFLQRLRSSMELPETFLQVLQWTGTEVTSGIRDGFTAEMSEFLEFLEMDEGALRAFLQNQMESGARFSGPLFQALRNAYGSTHSELLQTEILQFARRFSDYSSTPHLEEKILRTTEDIADALPSRWGAPVRELLSQLEDGMAAGDRAGNLKLLRQQLFPLVSRYVSATHDHGPARAFLSMLALDVARYENGGEDGLLQSLRHLVSLNILNQANQANPANPANPADLVQGQSAETLQNGGAPEESAAAENGETAAPEGAGEAREGAPEAEGALEGADRQRGGLPGQYGLYRAQSQAEFRLPPDLNRLDDQSLLRLLKNTAFSRASEENEFADRIADVTQRALKGEGGVKHQSAFHNIMNSVLINESVYMPLQHVMIPLNWNGELMFSEMWVDPDADREKNSSASRGTDRTVRLLIKMDIQSLGAFDVLINCQQERVSLQVGCPRVVSGFSGQISDALRTILSRNGFSPETIRVSEMQRPLTVSEVFPRLFQKRGGVNVKV